MKKVFFMVALLVLGYAYAYGWDKRAAIQAYIQQQQMDQVRLDSQLRNMEWELMNMKTEPPTPPAMVPGSAAERAAAVQRAKGVFFKDSYHGKRKNTRRVEDGY